MRIAVVGAGGTGSYFGGLLVRAGQDVTFIARGANLEALRARGLTVQSQLAGTFTLPVKATDSPSDGGPVDLVLFCVKTYDVDAAAESIRALMHSETMLLSLQNGIGNEERIAQAAGHGSGIGALAYVVSTIQAPGVVARVTAVTRLPIGTILADTATHDLFRRTTEEVEAVARAGKIDLPADCVEHALATAAAAEPWATSSLYHDLAGGRRLELESLNGELVRRGGELGVETPLNFAIYAALRPYVDGEPALP